MVRLEQHDTLVTNSLGNLSKRTDGLCDIVGHTLKHVLNALFTSRSLVAGLATEAFSFELSESKLAWRKSARSYER